MGTHPPLASLLNETLPVPPPLCPHLVSEWGATGERLGVSLAGFCMPFLPCWLVNNLLSTSNSSPDDVYPAGWRQFD